MSRKRLGSSSHSVERLARNLSLYAQLSFDERKALLFSQKARETIARTRATYRQLAQNLNERTQSSRGVEVLLDNYYIVEGALVELLASWKYKETLRVPQSSDVNGEKLPRVYLVAREFIKRNDAKLSREVIVDFLKTYQRGAPLSIRELDIFPDMLRYVLIEELLQHIEENLVSLKQIGQADLWYSRIIKISRQKGALSQLKKLTSLLASEYSIIPQAFGLHLLHRLAQTGKEGDIRVVSKWLKLSLAKQGATFTQLSAVSARAERVQAVTVSNAVTSLRYLAQVRWDKISLELNAIDAILLKDPTNTFALLSDETRSLYQWTIVRIAHKTGTHDIEVAREALRLAKQNYDSKEGVAKRTQHVGYFLIDKGVVDLEIALGYVPKLSERAQRFILKNSTRVYLGFVSAITLFASIFLMTVSGAVFLPFFSALLLFLVGLILTSEVALALAHFIFSRILESKPLPLLNLEGGIGNERRTVIVMPSMFRDAASDKKLLRRMETNFVANKDPNIFFALLMDYRDSQSEHLVTDDKLVSDLALGVDELNRRYPSETPRFNLFYRERRWNSAEKMFMGWERKRGKLREFNRLLRGENTSYVGNAKALAAQFGHVQYLITLDEETELIRDSARVLIGTIDHPLNRPVVNKAQKLVTEGFGIIQPRSALRFEEGNRSAFARLFGSFPGIDTYSSLVSDLHQDLFGEGIFHGKGIYDIDVVEETMAGRIPDDMVLSHDLLEGLYARVGISSGAHIFEGFPSNYREHTKRLHRWIRGDWQIVSWLFQKRGGLFSTIAQFKIFDNLRRSMLPIAAVLAVSFSAFSSADESVWSVAALLALGSGQLVSAILNITERTVDWRLSIGIFTRFTSMVVGFGIALAKTFLLGVFALHTAIITTDAIIRSLWRLLVSKKKLLEWQTAYDAMVERQNTVSSFVKFMWTSVCASLFLVYLEFQGGHVGEVLPAMWIIGWVTAPFFATVISIDYSKTINLSAVDRLYLQKIAARTYWFFLDMATADEQWLAPDHLQEEPPHKRHSHGLGVSPTNLGMYLLSLSGATALGLASVSEYAERMQKAFVSMSKMVRLNGHFYNWYELKGLTPLPPNYVSSVDSANLALSLFAVRGAFRDVSKAPVVNHSMIEGLISEIAVLSEACENILQNRISDRHERKLIEEVRGAAGETLVILREALTQEVTPRAIDLVWSGVMHHAVRTRNALETLQLEGKSERFEDLFLAARHAESSAAVYRDDVTRYLGHSMISVVSCIVNEPTLHSLYLKLALVLKRVPSIEEIARGKVRESIEAIGMHEAISLSELPPQEKGRAVIWYAEVIDRLSASERHAVEIDNILVSCASEAERYIKEMDFGFLYNKERGLFHIGYNGTAEQLDEAFYDLLASEANSASIVGIAKQDVPQEHWTYLGRKLIKSSNGSIVVSSWAGSLFEYLGTLLYFDVPHESFWGVSAQRAIATHQHFAKKYNIPWGMGESASTRKDAAQNYHYQAFGEPSLGFKRDLSESVVVAPYTSALALPFASNKVLENFARLAEEGAFGRYGFYDAIDFSTKKESRGAKGVPVKIYYAHHQGFIFSSIVNVLTDGWVQNIVAQDPQMEVATQLLEEKMPQDVLGEKISVVVPVLLSTHDATTDVLSIRRSYLPWRTKEAVSLFHSSNAYHSRITTTGAGESCIGDINITRLSSDMLRESVGTFFYLYNSENDALWSPTYMPTRESGDKHSVSSGEQVVVFDKTKGVFSSSLLVTPLPGELGELRELTIKNSGDNEAYLSFGICAELSMCRSAEELSHPNYEFLFVATETYWNNKAIIASRPDPEDRNREIVAGFLVVSDTKIESLHAVRGKETFYGSPQSKEAPPILRDFSRANDELPEYTLDSVAAFVGRVRLQSNESRRISLVMVAGYSKEEVLTKLKKYRDAGTVQKIAESANKEGGRSLAELGITAIQASTYSSMASLVLARAMNSGKSDKAEETRPWTLALWKMSISGTRPFIVLTVSGVTDLPMIRQILSCHTYFVKRGIAVDIIILNNHSGGYLKTFEDEIDFLLNSHRATPESPGCNVYHVHTEYISENEHSAILSSAVIRIDAKKGSLVDAVSVIQRNRITKYPQKLEVKTRKVDYILPEAITGNKGSDLQMWNGIGGYDASTEAYVIYSREDNRPPRPWVNIIANEHIGFLSTDRGVSYSWTRNSYDNKLTIPHVDPLSDFTGEAFYVRDEETGVFASPLPICGSVENEYKIEFGMNYCTYSCVALGLTLELTMYLSESDSVKYYRVKIINNGKKERTLSVFGYFELLMGSSPTETKKHFSFNSVSGNTIIATQNYRHQFLESRVFMGAVNGVTDFTTSREEFLGRNGNMRTPEVFKRKGFSNNLISGGDTAVGLRKEVLVPSEGSATTTFFIGETNVTSLEFVLERIVKLDIAEKSLETAMVLKNTPKAPVVDLPDESLSLLMNRFLPNQTLASRIHARLGFSQMGGAYGFRDQLQDALAVLWYDPKWVRGHLLVAAAHQFREGDVLSWWQPHNNIGSRTRLSDPQLWLPYVAIRYARFTGDTSIFDEVTPYLSGDIPDKADRQSIVGVFLASDEKSSLYEHMIRAVEHSLTFGIHGLPLMGAADWNDGMNRVGVEGIGESVWLAWFTISILDDMSVLTEERGDIERAMRYRVHAKEYRDAIQKSAWDGRWYRRAFTDKGALVGSSSAKAFHIDSIVQSWSYFTNGITKETKVALHSAKEELSVYEGHIPLAWPPSSRAILDLGTISDYPPGVRENASQYNHAALWLAQALFGIGDSDAGKLVVDTVNPIKRSATKDMALTYRGEPYAVAAEIYSAPTYAGRAGWTWYTASAGMLYRTVLENLLGLERRGDTLAFNPSFPSDWTTASINIPYGKAIYSIKFEVTSEQSAPVGVSLDGVVISGNTITLEDSENSHSVLVQIKRV